MIFRESASVGTEEVALEIIFREKVLLESCS